MLFSLANAKKRHAAITDSEPNFTGLGRLNEDLLDAARPGAKAPVCIWNINKSERIITCPVRAGRDGRPGEKRSTNPVQQAWAWATLPWRAAA